MTSRHYWGSGRVDLTQKDGSDTDLILLANPLDMHRLSVISVLSQT